MTSDQDQLITALTAMPEAEGDDGYLTFRDIMRKVSMSENKLYAMLRGLDDAGQLDCKRVARRSIAGNIQTVPAYRLARHETDETTS